MFYNRLESLEKRNKKMKRILLGNGLTWLEKLSEIERIRKSHENTSAVSVGLQESKYIYRFY